jgi:hypothetical protein
MRTLPLIALLALLALAVGLPSVRADSHAADDDDGLLGAAAAAAQESTDAAAPAAGEESIELVPFSAYEFFNGQTHTLPASLRVPVGLSRCGFRMHWKLAQATALCGSCNKLETKLRKLTVFVGGLYMCCLCLCACACVCCLSRAQANGRSTAMC